MGKRVFPLSGFGPQDEEKKTQNPIIAFFFLFKELRFKEKEQKAQEPQRPLQKIKEGQEIQLFRKQLRIKRQKKEGQPISISGF